jgi:lipopolysaccharide transport system ATP-binding protein
MYVRLAFAVAAHLEPEILLVDEVLAVGDAAFQKKCLGKMDNVAKSGRTVLFVSHNLGAVRTLCNRAILLNNGTVSLCGHTNHIVAAYLKTLEEVACQNLLDRSDRRGFGDVRLTEVSVTVPGNPSSTALLVGRPGRFVFRFNKLLPMMSCRFTIVDQQGYKVVHFISGATCSNDTYDPSIGPMYICEVEELTLAPGRYGINVLVQTGSALQDYLEAAASFDVRPGVLGGRVISEETPCGAVCLGHRWTIGTLH